MQLHHLQKHSSQRVGRRKGRGGKRGTYSGRGIKGLGARAGGKFRPAEREILKKIPKLRGYKFQSWRQQPAVVNIGDLNRHFREGDTVSPTTLLTAHLIARRAGRIPSVKILGKGVLAKNLVFKNVALSASVRARMAAPTK